MEQSFNPGLALINLSRTGPWCLHNNSWKIKTKTKPRTQLNAAKAGRRVPHPHNGHTLQTTIPKSYPRLALVLSPLIRAGKIVIYANRINI